MTSSNTGMGTNLTVSATSVHGVTEMRYPVRHILEGPEPTCNDRVITPVLNKKYISADVIMVDYIIYSYRETLPDGTRIMESRYENE